MTIFIKDFGNIICSVPVANKIYAKLREILLIEDEIIIDFTGVLVFELQCSIKIFRALYVMCGPDVFYERIFFRNITNAHYRIVQKSLISVW